MTPPPCMRPRWAETVLVFRLRSGAADCGLHMTRVRARKPFASPPASFCRADAVPSGSWS
eukprot:11117004-Alexandrium_andersonii.AAC.1